MGKRGGAMPGSIPTKHTHTHTFALIILLANLRALFVETSMTLHSFWSSFPLSALIGRYLSLNQVNSVGQNYAGNWLLSCSIDRFMVVPSSFYSLITRLKINS